MCVLPCVKSSLFLTSEDLQGDVWFWFAHSQETTTSSGEMLSTAHTKLLTQELSWSYTLLWKQLKFDLELSSPRVKAYFLWGVDWGRRGCWRGEVGGWYTWYTPRYTFLVWTNEHNTSTWRSGLSSVAMENLSKPVLRPAGAQQLLNTQKQHKHTQKPAAAAPE